MSKRRFSEAQIKDIIDSIVILVDSREKSNSHIIDCFDKYNVSWEKRKLDSGDYSAIVPASQKYNLEEIDFTKELVIERKASLDEISNNLAAAADRFKREFERSEAKIIIMIEGCNYEDIPLHNYKSKLTEKAFLGLLHAFSDKHNAPVSFISKDFAALFIYNTFKYRLRNMLKEMKLDEQ